MFHHVKELQFNARVSKPDPRFAALLLEQFGGPNGELKAALQYFVQAFAARMPFPDKYDLLMDTATEEFSHLEIVGATITMLLDGVNGDLKNAAEQSELMKMLGGKAVRDEMIHGLTIMPQFFVLNGGGPQVTDSQGVPFSGSYINANSDLTVDLRSNIAAESRAKIVYEYLLQFTDDPLVQESLRFLMTREITHFQQFTAALATIEPNFPPGVLQGDARYTHLAYNMSNGNSARGPWNEGQGPWDKGEEWVYVEDPVEQAQETDGQLEQPIAGTSQDPKTVAKLEKQLSKVRSQQITKSMPDYPMQWSNYGEFVEQ
jgi:Mn-containing catalase